LATTAYRSSIRAAFAGSLRDVPTAARSAIGNQIGDAVSTSHLLPGGLGRATREAANHAFVVGLHLAALVGLGVMVVSTLAAARYVPSRVALNDDEQIVGHL
jgi:hypothetical protein